MIILHTESSMNFGGQELRICLEMEKLRQYGVYSILACRPKSKIATIAKEKGLKYYEVPFNTTLDPISISRLCSIIRNNKVDIINSHGSKDAWNAAFICKAKGIPFVRSRHIGLQPRKHVFGRMIYTTLADKVLVTGKYIANLLIQQGVKPEKISIIPTGVDINKFSGAKHLLFKKELCIKEDIILVGFISVVRSDKGPHYFVKSVPYILKYFQKVKFVIVGSGNFYEKVKSLVNDIGLSDYVLFTGHRSDIDFIMKGIDFFVLPAVKPRDPEGLANAILYLIENKDIAERLSQDGKKNCCYI